MVQVVDEDEEIVVRVSISILDDGLVDLPFLLEVRARLPIRPGDNIGFSILVEIAEVGSLREVLVAQAQTLEFPVEGGFNMGRGEGCHRAHAQEEESLHWTTLSRVVGIIKRSGGGNGPRISAQIPLASISAIRILRALPESRVCGDSPWAEKKPLTHN